MLQKIIYRFFFFFLLKFIHIKFEGFVYSSFLIPLLIIINEILPIIIFLYIHYSIYIYLCHVYDKFRGSTDQSVRRRSFSAQGWISTYYVNGRETYHAFGRQIYTLWSLSSFAIPSQLLDNLSRVLRARSVDGNVMF